MQHRLFHLSGWLVCLLFLCCAVTGCDKSNREAGETASPPASTRLSTGPQPNDSTPPTESSSAETAKNKTASPDATDPADKSADPAAKLPVANGRTERPSAEPPARSPESTGKPSKQANAPQQANKIVDTSFDDIKFEMDKTEPFQRKMLTEEINNLVNKKIRIRGYILPTAFQTGLTEFVLVRDNMECCFGPGAALYDCILVEMKPGKSTDFSVRPVAVEGTFSIQEIIGPDRKHLAIYHLEGEKVVQ